MRSLMLTLLVSLTTAFIVEPSYAASSPLMKAIEQGDLKLIENLFQEGLDLEEKNEQGQTALILATSYGHTQIMAALLQAGANPHNIDTNGNTALHYALARQDPQMIDILMVGSFNFNDQHGATTPPPSTLYYVILQLMTRNQIQILQNISSADLGLILLYNNLWIGNILEASHLIQDVSASQFLAFLDNSISSAQQIDHLILRYNQARALYIASHHNNLYSEDTFILDPESTEAHLTHMPIILNIMPGMINESLPAIEEIQMQASNEAPNTDESIDLDLVDTTENPYLAYLDTRPSLSSDRASLEEIRRRQTPQSNNQNNHQLSWFEKSK